MNQLTTMIAASWLAGSVPRKSMHAALVLVATLLGSHIAIAQSVNGLSDTVAPNPFVLGPPKGNEPVKIQTGFELVDINLINDEAQVFEFTGTLMLK